MTTLTINQEYQKESQEQQAHQEQYGELYAAQLEIEAEFKQTAATAMEKAWTKRKEEGEASTLSLGQKLIAKEWGTVLENVTKFIEYTLAPKRGVKPAYLHIVKDLDHIYTRGGEEEEQADGRQSLCTLCAYATFTALVDHIFGRYHDFSAITGTVATIIQDEAQLEAFAAFEATQHGIAITGMTKRHKRTYRKAYLNAIMDRTKDFTPPKWPLPDLKHLGAKLIELVMDGCGYFEFHQPVDLHGRNKPLEIRATQWLLDTWTKNEGNLLDKAFYRCPTVIPPRPWESFTDGGYYGDMAVSEKLLRVNTTTGGKFSRDYIKKLDQVDLSQVLGAVNAIQATPWRVNQRVLEILEHIIETGGDRAGIPRLEPFPKLPRLPEGHSEEELDEHKKKAVEIIHLENNRKGRAARTLAMYRMARRFAEFDRVYFPHNMDFRGRVYPIPSFGPQGDDMTKALLLFADPPECQEMEDIGWMMVHGANLAGVDKVSYEDRKQWILDHEEQILKVAADPLGYLWWSEQDEPMQFLAFCFEWARWKEWEAAMKGPQGFKTGLAVAFDGTCSGLQHFSAILRDPVGGSAVNLVPGPKPRDIYGVVAEEVNKRLQWDAQKGTTDETKEGKDKTSGDPYSYLKYGTKTLAQQWLAYGVNRKVTKRPVMTLAYGSKEYGFREQLLTDIIQPAIDEGRGGMFKVAKSQAAAYMAKLIWLSVQNVVVSAVDGMKWLQEVARIVCKGGHPVTWVTPMGLPVQQHYIEGDSSYIDLRVSGHRQRLYTFTPSGNIDRRAQAQAIAPNFIHSMDAAHLQLTVLTAQSYGIYHFAMIHDSYGAPVAHAKVMYQAVRDAFITMYDQKDHLAKFQQDLLPFAEENTEWPDFPDKGSLNIQIIKDSEYMFS